jgi:diaminopimelate decarboxylase
MSAHPFHAPTPRFAGTVFDHETPVVLYDLPRLRRTATVLSELCQPFGDCCFAVKANRHPRVLSELAGCGFGADIASAAELALAQNAAFSPVVTTAPGLPLEVAVRVAAAGGTVFFDHLEQVRAAAAAGVDVHRHGLRISVPGPYASFGFGAGPELEALRAELGGKLPRKLHFHCGEVESYERLAGLLPFFERFIDASRATHVDLGGGYGVLSNDLAAMEAAFALLRDFAGRHGVRLIFEFGKVATARCGTLVAGVIARKLRYGRQVVVLDTSSFNVGTLERHRVWRTSARPGDSMPTRLIGSSCYEGDVFASDLALPPLTAGDKVAFSQFGAYTMSVAASLHALPLPREVMFEG